MYKMTGEERDHPAMLFCLESHAWVPDVLQFWKDKYTGWQGHPDFDKLSSDKSLVIINVSLMRNDKHLVMEC